MTIATDKVRVGSLEWQGNDPHMIKEKETRATSKSNSTIKGTSRGYQVSIERTLHSMVVLTNLSKTCHKALARASA